MRAGFTIAVVCAVLASAGVAGAEDGYLQQSPGVHDPKDPDVWRAKDPLGGLLPYPQACPPGMLNPKDPLYRYGGRGWSSFAGPDDLKIPFSAWLAQMARDRPTVDRRAHQVLAHQYDLTCRHEKGVTMSGGKPQPIGPTARLHKGFASWEAFDQQTPEQIRKDGDFPYPPLDHPLASTAHTVFPNFWLAQHPEHARVDVGFDIPGCFLPEFPPPMYLTNHKELGDVTRGVEVTYGNYYKMFDGLLTPEQMDGLRLLVTPFQTTWFNATSHRVTRAPSQGMSCFACHVNGHTNAAFELTPDGRPQWARLRDDTPSMRGNYAFQVLSNKRSVRSLNHFSEEEEYFDGDPTVQAAIGGRDLNKVQTNHMGDFNAIIDFPPAPKLDALNRLIPAKSTPSELRGEKIFGGKGQCIACHRPSQQFQDDSMHDLQVERFYPGRPEGPFKTYSLRGIKDSPPYLHDGRLLTLEDTVEFFNLVLEDHLTAQEKTDLTAYLRAL